MSGVRSGTGWMGKIRHDGQISQIESGSIGGANLCLGRVCVHR